MPGGPTVKVKNEILVESIYGNQIVRSDEGGTFEATAPGRRANGIVQGYIKIPKNIVGMKDGDDEGTILLKDNHGPGGNKDKQYKIFFLYKEGGKVDGIEAAVEHTHKPNDIQVLKDVKFVNQPKFDAGGKLEFKASYQDTNDDGVRLRMDYRDQTGKWTRLFDHVDYGDKKNGRPYRGRSGVQDGTRVDGRVGGGKPSEDDARKYRAIEGKSIGPTTKLSDELKDILSKLATSAIWAREIEPDESDLHDGNDDPISFGPK